jgi:hypothetical protein
MEVPRPQVLQVGPQHLDELDTRCNVGPLVVYQAEVRRRIRP